ncbi:MAG: hypothetical protein M3Z96_13005 [Pseudomonadota bacterium]|nr:hypothetical protein [Pseudomonadota bacterium]
MTIRLDAVAASHPAVRCAAEIREYLASGPKFRVQFNHHFLGTWDSGLVDAALNALGCVQTPGSVLSAGVGLPGQEAGCRSMVERLTQAPSMGAPRGYGIPVDGLGDAPRTRREPVRGFRLGPARKF